jgi:hypothetical protein
LYREIGFKRRAGVGTRFGSGTGSGDCGPPVRGLLHYQGSRHGYRFGHLPFDHRSARWATVGEGERALRRHLSIRIAHPHGASIVIGSETVTRRLMPARSRKRRVLTRRTRPTRVAHDGVRPPAGTLRRCILPCTSASMPCPRSAGAAFAQDFDQRVRKKFLVGRVGKR